jgi:hypothetical protein
MNIDTLDLFFGSLDDDSIQEKCYLKCNYTGWGIKISHILKTKKNERKYLEKKLNMFLKSTYKTVFING